jgi:peptide/nickel transport system substrate-binding protein
MQYASFFASTLRRISIVVCVGLLLAACEVEGGVSRTDTPTLAPTPVQLSTGTALAVAQAARDDTWSIGLLDEPKSLYPYARDAGAQRITAPLTELLFPSPILSVNYGYTTTGVLERIPTLENGDAQIRKAQVFLDPTGIITTTSTDVITQVDQLVVTFHWNKQLRWSDGTPVTADDSVFAYELAKQAPPGDDARDRLGQTEAYEKVDDHTTRAILRPDIIEPTYFLNYWTPLPRHLLQGVAPGEAPTSAFASAPVGYGPYAIEQRAPREISMVRNPHYFGAPPAAGRLVVTFMDSLELLRGGIADGTLDVMVSDRVPVDQFAPFDQLGNQMARVIYQPNPIWTHIDFNLDVPVLQDIRLRRAIVYGTNRQAMVDKLFSGRSPVLESWVLPGQPEAAPLDEIPRYPYDPAQAGKLLDEAGFTAGADGIRASPDGVTLTFQLVTVENKGYPILEQAANMFRENMKAIGIDIEITPLPADQLFAPDGPLFQRQFEMALFAWIASADPGGLPLWSCNAVPSEQNDYSGDNFAGWCFRDANRAIRMAVTSLDPDERKAAYLLQQQKWAQEVPAVPLFQRLSVALVEQHVQGPHPDALAPITWNVVLWRRTK